MSVTLSWRNHWISNLTQWYNLKLGKVGFYCGKRLIVVEISDENLEVYIIVIGTSILISKQKNYFNNT